MGITDRDLEKAIGSTEASFIRGKMGIKEGNRYIQELHNNLFHKKSSRHCGYD